MATVVLGVSQNVTVWKKKKKKVKKPYLRVSAGPQRGEYVHRMIAEALLRRKLLPNETVDHKNTKSLDCDPRNIQVLSWHNHGKATRSREREKKGFEGITYDVILDGEKIFDVRKPIMEMAASADVEK
jgi:hypothetical protein